MRDEILALVEERPYTILELAGALGANQWTLRDHVAQLEAHGVVFVERRGRKPAMVGLARTPVAPAPVVERRKASPPPPVPKPHAKVLAPPFEALAPANKVCHRCGNPFPPRSNAQRICVPCRTGGAQSHTFDPKVPRTRQALADTTVEDLLAIHEDVVGTHVCERCGGRFTPGLGASGRFCTRRCYETPAAAETTTIIVDGQEYEAISVGKHPLTEWPDAGVPRGSSLSGTHGVIK